VRPSEDTKLPTQLLQGGEAHSQLFCHDLRNTFVIRFPRSLTMCVWKWEYLFWKMQVPLKFLVRDFSCRNNFFWRDFLLARQKSVIIRVSAHRTQIYKLN
jgi:hypothetical protein